VNITFQADPKTIDPWTVKQHDESLESIRLYPSFMCSMTSSNTGLQIARLRDPAPGLGIV
jgi:hypothetical protein